MMIVDTSLYHLRCLSEILLTGGHVRLWVALLAVLRHRRFFESAATTHPACLEEAFGRLAIALRCCKAIFFDLRLHGGYAERQASDVACVLLRAQFLLWRPCLPGARPQLHVGLVFCWVVCPSGL